MADSILSGGLRVSIGGGQGARLSLERAAHPLARAPVALPHFVAVPASTLPGRDEHVAKAVGAVASWAPLGFHGPPGSGRTTLLRHLTRLLSDRQPPGAVVALQLRDNRLDDLLQRLLTAIYRPDRPVRPPEHERARLLAEAESIVLLDGVALGPAELARLAGALPRCMLIVAAERRLAGLDCEWLMLAPLPEDEAADMVRSELEQASVEHGLEHVVRLCRALDGHPLRLRLATSLVRDLGAPLGALADRAERDPSIAERLSLQVLDDQKRQVLAVLALAPGVPVPGELVTAMLGLEGAGRHLAVLSRRGVVRRDEDGFALALAPSRRRGDGEDRDDPLGHLDVDGAVRALASWFEGRPLTSARARAALDLAIATVGLSAGKGDATTAIRLVGAIEPILALAGRWEAWRDTLEQGIDAARTSGDRFAEADFAHELGTLKLCLGEVEEARALLTRTSAWRQAHGDARAAEATRRNLAVSRDSGLARLDSTLLRLPGTARSEEPPAGPALEAAAGQEAARGPDPAVPAGAQPEPGVTAPPRRRRRRRRRRRSQAARAAAQGAPGAEGDRDPHEPARPGDDATEALPGLPGLPADAATVELSAREIQAALSRDDRHIDTGPQDPPGAPDEEHDGGEPVEAGSGRVRPRFAVERAEPGDLSSDQAVAELEAFREELPWPAEGPAAAAPGERPEEAASASGGARSQTDAAGSGERAAAGAAAGRSRARFMHQRAVADGDAADGTADGTADGAADGDPAAARDPLTPDARLDAVSGLEPPLAMGVGIGAVRHGQDGDAALPMLRSWWRHIRHHARLLLMVAGLALTALLAVLAVASPDARSRDARPPTPAGGAQAAPTATLPTGAATPTTTASAATWSADLATLDFGGQRVGRASSERVMRVRNRSGRTGEVTAVVVQGASRDFRTVTRCTGVPLPSGYRCRVAVRFTPHAAGASRARLRISVSGTPRQLVVALRGTGVAA